MVELRGIEPRISSTPEKKEPPQNCAKSIQNSALSDSSGYDEKQRHALSAHNPHISVHSKRVPEEYQIPDDLAEVITAWPHLPQKVRAEILARVRARGGNSPDAPSDKGER
jgi:hypothetical protein